MIRWTYLYRTVLYAWFTAIKIDIDFGTFH